jgi:hypothetical protein
MLRSCCLLGEMGDIEITWDEDGDEEMRRIIQKKMDGGMKFFQIVVNGKSAKRTRLKKLADLVDMKINVADEDIERAFTDGTVQFNRLQGGEDRDSIVRVDNAAIAAKTNTVGVQQFKGG